jgi:hypothetical protein
MNTTPRRAPSERNIVSIVGSGVDPPDIEASSLEWARYYVDNYSWVIFPIDRATGMVLVDIEDAPSIEEVVEWWTAFPDALIGLALGVKSGVMAAIWVEGTDKGANFERLQALGTLGFEITHGGRAWLLRHDDYWSGACDLDESLFMLGEGCFVLLPPVHAGGGELRGRFAGKLDEFDGGEVTVV